MDPDDTPNPVSLTREDLDHVVDRLEDLMIGLVKMMKDVPQVAEAAIDAPEDIPEQVLDLPTPERESESVAVKRRRYL